MYDHAKAMSSGTAALESVNSTKTDVLPRTGEMNHHTLPNAGAKYMNSWLAALKYVLRPFSCVLRST
jgi:hypothetical protein